MSTKNQESSLDEQLEQAITSAEQAVLDEATGADAERVANLTSEEMALEYAQAQAKASESQDKLVRLQAEMENLRRRTERDVAAAHKYGSEKLIKDLLPVVDGLQRGLELEVTDNPEVKAMHEGMEMTMKLLRETLEKNGVKQLNPEGEPFNPLEMEAISMQPSPNVDPNTVLLVVQKGYSLNGRLMRPSLVIVST